MKNIVFLTLILIAGISRAQQAQKIISPAIKMESNDWYNEQLKLWKEKVDKSPTNEDIWYNYFRACNYSKDCGKDELIKISEAALKDIPETFTYYYMKERLDGFNSPFLDSAFAKNPNIPDIWEGLLVRAISNNEKGKMVLFAEKLFNSDEEDVNLYHWAYNLLNSLEKNAIVFTHGDNDSFGAWILQGAKNIRPDVVVMNTSLMMDSTYLSRYWSEFFPKEELPNLQNYYTNNKIEWDNGHAFTRFLMRKFGEKGRPIHITIGTPEFFRTDFGEENLFLTGLTFKYDPDQKTSSIASLIKNYETIYKLDYLEQRYFSNIWDEKAKQMNKTYLTGLIKLYIHYQQTGNREKLAWCESLITTIEPNPEKRKGYGDYIKEETGYTPIEFNGLYINSKHLIKKYKEIDVNLFASSTEVTNREFMDFMDDLKNNDQENFKKYYPDTTLWTKSYPESHIKPMEHMYNWHPAYDNYPVINITKSAAEDYCNWLTLQYNNDPKRKYGEVKFFLPTEEQWKLAAGNIGPIKNKKDCYVYNGLWKDQEGKGRLYDDGGFFMVTTESYIENSKGLYCIYGNVSEMVSDKTYTKGGGWYTAYKDMNLNSKHESGPHPTVGFRVFMKIIQK